MFVLTPADVLSCVWFIRAYIQLCVGWLVVSGDRD
jgi:hypothetical protein